MGKTKRSVYEAVEANVESMPAALACFMSLS